MLIPTGLSTAPSKDLRKFFYVIFLLEEMVCFLEDTTLTSLFDSNKVLLEFEFLKLSFIFITKKIYNVKFYMNYNMFFRYFMCISVNEHCFSEIFLTIKEKMQTVILIIY